MDELRRLFAYNRWATLRILDAAAELTSEELTRDLKSSFPSVLATLVHGLGAEWVWLERWNGRVVTMLRQLGKTPPSTDYVRWMREVT